MMLILVHGILFFVALTIAQKTPDSVINNDFTVFASNKFMGDTKKPNIEERLVETLEDEDEVNSKSYDANNNSTNGSNASSHPWSMQAHKRSKDDKGGKIMLIPLLIGFKVAAFLVSVVSFIGLLTLKAFIASKVAILIAVVVGLKKLFSEHKESNHETFHESSHYEPEYYYQSADQGTDEIAGYQDVDPLKFSAYDLLKDQKDLSFETDHAKEKNAYEIQEHQAGSDVLIPDDVHAVHRDVQRYKQEDQKRRVWKTIGKRKVGSTMSNTLHHSPVIMYRKVVTGRNL